MNFATEAGARLSWRMNRSWISLPIYMSQGEGRGIKGDEKSHLGTHALLFLLVQTQ